jgi:hypothetical protein
MGRSFTGYIAIRYININQGSWEYFTKEFSVAVTRVWESQSVAIVLQTAVHNNTATVITIMGFSAGNDTVIILGQMSIAIIRDKRRVAEFNSTQRKATTRIYKIVRRD